MNAIERMKWKFRKIDRLLKEHPNAQPYLAESGPNKFYSIPNPKFDVKELNLVLRKLEL
jgi:hypothetical protein